MSSEPAPEAQNVVFQTDTIVPGDSSAITTPKRRPGRPKGSGKKQHAEPKVKRPVGRPRKDGLPAGSTNGARSRKPVSSGSSPPRATVSVKPVYEHLQPDFDGADWLVMSNNKPAAFIDTLLGLLNAPNPVSPAGTVEDAFKTHLNSLSTNSTNQNIPSLYSVLRTFWLPTSPSYFCLTGANAVRPLLQFRFIYWDPQPLVFNGVPCPHCGTSLSNRGRIASGPIKVYDLEQPFFIIGCEYVCQSNNCIAAVGAEGRKFSSTDPAIFRSLPSTLADEFPARLRHYESDLGSSPEVWNWKPRGVSKGLWNMVQGSLRSCVRKEVIIQIVKTIQHGLPDGTQEPPAAVQPLDQPVVVAVVEEEDSPTNDEMILAEDPESMADQIQEPMPMGHIEPSFKEYSAGWKVHMSDSDPQPSQATTTQSTGPPLSQPSYMYSVEPPRQPSPPTTVAPSAMSYQTYFSSPPNGGPSNPTTTPPTIHAHPMASTTPASDSSHTPDATAGIKRTYPFDDNLNVDMRARHTQPYQPPPPPPPSLAGTLTMVESPPKRAPRHCSKCGSMECKGKGGRTFCQNPCRDCGKVDCAGRVSRKQVCANRTSLSWGM